MPAAGPCITVTRSIQLTTIVLAAGRSSRSGFSNKLLWPCGDVSILERTVSEAVAAGGPVILVTGHDRSDVQAAVSGYPAIPVFNTRHDRGMGASIARGVHEASRASFYLIWPADMPLIRASTAEAIKTKASVGRIAVPTFDGQRGHPVLFSRSFREELLALTGDTGARSILERHAESVDEIPVQDEGILFDVDTLEAHAELLRRLTSQ